MQDRRSLRAFELNIVEGGQGMVQPRRVVSAKTAWEEKNLSGGFADSGHQGGGDALRHGHHEEGGDGGNRPGDEVGFAPLRQKVRAPTQIDEGDDEGHHEDHHRCHDRCEHEASYAFH